MEWNKGGGEKKVFGWLDRIMRKESWIVLYVGYYFYARNTTTYILMTVAAQHKREEESGRLSKIHPSFSLWLDRRVGEEEASSK